MTPNPFRDDRVETILKNAGVEFVDYQWTGKRVDVRSLTQSVEEIVRLLTIANDGFPVAFKATTLEWADGNFVSFFVLFNEQDNWRILSEAAL